MADDIVGEVSVRVVPDLSQFPSDLQRKLNVVSQTAVASGATINKALGNVGGGANAASQAIQGATASAKQLGKAVDENVSSFAQASLTAAGFTAAIYGVRRAVDGAVGKLAGLFDQLAMARAGFTSILKSETAANALLADIREFARVSPFVTQELVNYSQQLLGVGQAAKTIVPLLRSVGDIVASVGGDQQSIGRVLFTLTQIRTIGRLIGQDARQLQSALIPITRYLSEYLGKTTEEIKKMQEAGSISADTVFAALTAAGNKVEGAMDRATKNIRGAKAILSDTLIILFQNQPVLQKIFEDTYKGIVKLANFTGSPVFQTAFNNFFDSVERGYEGVKPLVTELLKIGGQGALVGLRTTTTLLGVLAGVLESFPEPVIIAIAHALAAMAALKAPLMLLRYAASIKTIVTGLAGGTVTAGFKGFTTGMTTSSMVAGKAATANYAVAASLKMVGQQALLTAAQLQVLNAAANAQGLTPKAGRGRLAGAAAGAGAIAAAIAGQMLQSMSSDNVAAQAGGSALTYGALGFMVGGPTGAAVGAGLGALVGYMSASEEKARKHVEAMKALGVKAAEEFIAGNYTGLKNATGNTAALFEAEMTRLNAKLAELNILNETNRQAYDPNEFLPPGMSSDIPFVGATDDKTKAQIERLKKQYDETFGPLREAIKNTLLGGVGEDAGTRNRFLQEFFDFSGPGVLAVKSVKEVEAALQRYGLTIADVSGDGGDALGRLIVVMNLIGNETQLAMEKASRFNAEFAKAKTTFDETFGARAKQIDTTLSVFDAQRTAAEALAAAYKDQGNEILKLRAASAVDKAAVLIGAKVEAEAFERSKNAATAHALGVAAAEKYVAQARVQSTATLNELSESYGVVKDRLAEILGLAKDFDPNIKLIVTADTADALAKYLQLLALQQRLLHPTGTIYGSADTLTAKYNVTSKSLQDTFTKLQGVGIPAVDQASSGGGGGGGGKSPFVDAATSLTQAIDSAKNATLSLTQALMSSIRERSQYDRGVSIGSLTRNASRQASDIAEIGVLTSSVLAKGLSESALTSIIGTLGIEDLKQLRKLNSASGTDIANLSAAVGRRDNAAIKTAAERSREEQKIVMIEAIVAAAKILGYKVDAKAAAEILATFNITSEMDAATVADAILGKLSGAVIST